MACGEIPRAAAGAGQLPGGPDGGPAVGAAGGGGGKSSFVHDFLCNKSKGSCDISHSFLSPKVRVRVILLTTFMSQMPRLINFAYFKSLNS